MSGGYYGNKYFPSGYFPDGYFGTEAEADPNAIRGTFAGAAAFSGTLTGVSVPSSQPSQGGGFEWDHQRRRRKRNREILAILLAA